MRFAFSLFMLLLCLQSSSVWAADESHGPNNESSSELGLHADALFDRARTTSSLRDYYRMRLNTPGLIDDIDLDFGIENIGINKYSVLTEFGIQEFNANIAFSFFRLDFPGSTEKQLFHFRGVDLSGKSVVIGKSFVVDGNGYFDPYGRVFQEDLCVFLFSLYRVKLDLGFLRSRVMDDIDSTGIRSEEISLEFKRFFTPHEADEYAFYFNNTIFSGFDLNLILGNLFKSVSPRLDIPSVLRFAGVYPSGGIAPYIQKGALWGTFSENTTSAGCEIEISNLSPTFLASSVAVPTDKTATVEEKANVNNIYGVGFSLKAEHEFRQNMYSLIRSDFFMRLQSWYFSAASSFLKDPLLDPFGAPSEGVWGWQAHLTYYLFEGMGISLSTAFNFVDDIQFMTGSFDHPVNRIAIFLRF